MRRGAGYGPLGSPALALRVMRDRPKPIREFPPTPMRRPSRRPGAPSDAACPRPPFVTRGTPAWSSAATMHVFFPECGWETAGHGAYSLTGPDKTPVYLNISAGFGGFVRPCYREGEVPARQPLDRSDRRWS